MVYLRYLIGGHLGPFQHGIDRGWWILDPKLSSFKIKKPCLIYYLNLYHVVLHVNVLHFLCIYAFNFFEHAMR